MADTHKKSKYDTPSKKKRFVEAEIQKAIKRAYAINPETELFLGGVYGSRRKKAIVNYLYRAEEEFSSLGLKMLDEYFVNNELVSLTQYNQLDNDFDLRIGAAIWILGKLRESGNLQKACDILPDVCGKDDAWYLPVDFMHPCYDNELIRSVIHIISKRYSEERMYGVVITEQNAVGKKPCDAYERLMELLPEKAIAAACEAFRTKLWELETRFMKGQAYYDTELEWIVREIQYDSSFFHGMQENQGVFAGMLPASMAQNNGNGIGEKRTRGRESDRVGDYGLPWLEDDFDYGVTDRSVELAFKGRNLIDASNEFFINFDNYLQMDKASVRRETNRFIADIMDGFRVEDPYELCFALFYLIDHGDDAPWLIRPGVSLMLYVQRMLPWYPEEEMDDDQWEEWCDGQVYDRNGWTEQEPVEDQLDYYHVKHGERNLSQIIYDLCRTVVPTGLHPFEADRKQLIEEGMDEVTARKLTDTAELLFLYEFRARKFTECNWDFSDESEKDLIEDEVTGAETDQAMNRHESLEEENEHLKEELNATKKQLKNLHEVLAVTRHDTSIERNELEHELKLLRMEHRELADLRELVFNREAKSPERLEKVTKTYKYPYETKKRTVIFGGHDTFIKALKPLLPDVRYIEAEYMNFSPDIIRNADVVWIQNNCIAHSQYWAIVKYCKRAGVQMRYFGYASAEKCAEQLVEWDEK